MAHALYNIIQLSLLLLTWTHAAGIVFQYITTPFLFWVVHIGYMIVLLQFPVFGNKKLRKRSVTITIHVVSVVSILLIQLLWPVITLSAFQYDITRFPPFIGQPGNVDLLFYTTVVPATVVGGSGIIMLVILVFIIHKVGVYVAEWMVNSAWLCVSVLVH